MLYGQLHIRAYDWRDALAHPLDAYHQAVPAKPVVDQTFEASWPLQCWPSSSYDFVLTVFTTVTTCVNTAQTHFTAVFPVAFVSYIRNDGVFAYHINLSLSSYGLKNQHWAP